MAAQRITEEQKDDILARYEAGEKTAYIAALYGVAVNYATMLAARRGMARRKRGHPKQ